MRAALRYAAKGLPVFPLRAGGKEPAIPRSEGGRGHLDATTDPSKITAWWNRYPGANVGMPTGERSGIFVLDVDPDEGGNESLAAFVAERGPIPATTTVRTGGGGTHYCLRYPPGSDIRNSASRLRPGLDVRGEGGYVVVPPSVTAMPYEWIDRRPPADPPEGLVAAVSAPSRPLSGGGGTGPAPSVDPTGPPIPEGTRDATLARIAGKLHDGTRDREALAADLRAINEARCEPPLPEAQVLKIARSIQGRTPCKKSTNPVSQETLDALGEIEAGMWRCEWRGMGELSARDVLVALIVIARRYGTRTPAGIRVSVSVRDLALKAAVSKPTAIKAVRRLRRAGLIRRDDGQRRGADAGAFVLLAGRANLYHSSTQGSLEREDRASGKTLRAPRLRWSAPRFDRVGGEVIRSTIHRLGKGAGAVIDALERARGSASVPVIAAALGKKRPRDLRRRAIARLEAAAVVECSGDIVSLTEDWAAALEREREAAGEVSALRRDEGKFARERDAYRNRNRHRTATAPTTAEMDRRRRDRASLGSAGEIRDISYLRELVPDGPLAPPAVGTCVSSPPTSASDPRPANAAGDGWARDEPPAVEILYGVMRREGVVVTPDGPGRLWQVFSSRVGVILDAHPDAVRFFCPADLRSGDAAR